MAQIGNKRPGSISAAVLANVELIHPDSAIFIELHVAVISKLEVRNIDVTLTWPR